jgi:hypothetical protein
MRRLKRHEAQKREVVYKGFTYDELESAFTEAANPNDWRAPISVQCSGEAVLLVAAAIEFYTATSPRVALNTRTMKYVIESEGYRLGPAGDH